MADEKPSFSIGDSRTALHADQITFTKGNWWQRRSTLEKVLIVLVTLFFIAAVVFLVLFIVFSKSDDDAGEDTCKTWDCLETASYLAQSIDPSVDPCEDFYQFSCGQWIERNPLTPELKGINNFVLIEQDLKKLMRDLLEAKEPDALEAIEKTRTFYSSCVDTDAMDEKGAQPLLDLLRSGGSGSSNLFPTLEPNWVDENLTLNEIIKRVSEVGDLLITPFVSMYVTADQKQSDKNIIYFSQVGLGLGSRSYYMQPRNHSSLMLYQKLYVDLMTALGANSTTAAQDAEDVVDFEILVANATLPRQALRQREERYNKMTLGELTQLFPQFDWLGYLQLHFAPEGINITMNETVVMTTKDYYDKMFDIVNATSQRTLLNYCLWSFVKPFSALLSKEFRDLNTKFSMALSGQTRSKERWEECLQSTDRLFPDVTGRLYVQKYSSADAKHKVEAMIGDLKDAFRDMVREADWMTDKTKEAALEKVDTIVNKIAYPLAILNDTYLNEESDKRNMTEAEFFENNMILKRLNTRKSLRKLREPVNKEKWLYSAAIVNAFYNPATNAIFFPAGILHKPFFSDKFMDAMNYGGIGFVIGHEITHGFDDQGRLYDKHGNMKMWWQKEDQERFKARSECVVKQYSSFVEPVVNMTVNGRLTLGEDIADNGGLKEAYRAYRKMVEKRGKEEPKLPVLGYTPDQLFFISAAQSWCGNMREKLRKLYLTIDFHSPMRFRVIGPMQNNMDFARAFNCPVGSYMNPEKKCHVW